MAFFIQCYDQNGFLYHTFGPFESYTMASDFASSRMLEYATDFEIEYLPTEN